MNYYSYDSDGNICNSGYCLESVFYLYKAEGLTFVQGYADPQINYVMNGVLSVYTQQELQEKATPPGLGYKWMPQTKTWVDVDSFQLTEQTVTEKRDKLLYQSDWTQIPNNSLTPEFQQQWAVYRQELRDVPQQSGYPFNVVWPTPPQG
jgi:hypothetical protein